MKLINFLRRRLGYYLIGYALTNRLERIEAQMDQAEQKMEDITNLESQLDRASNNEQYKVWSDLYFRLHDTHSEISALIDYLSGPL
jgi:hypothetical protein